MIPEPKSLRSGNTLPLKRKWRWLAAFALVVAGAFMLLGTYTKRPEPSALPDLTLRRLNGDVTALNTLAGQPVVVNLWATWCGPCRRELPLLAETAARHPEVRFVFVNQLEPQARVSSYLEAQNVALPLVLLDPKGEIAEQFQSRGLPTTLFFDETGTLTQAHLGELSSVQLFNAVTGLQKE